MDKETAELIRELADRLGVTSEYLWAALLKQAPISGIVDVVWYAGLALTWVYWNRWYQRTKTYYEAMRDRDEIVFLLPVLIATVLFILSILACFSVSNTLAAFFNPAYWALHEIKP